MLKRIVSYVRSHLLPVASVATVLLIGAVATAAGMAGGISRNTGIHKITSHAGEAITCASSASGGAYCAETMLESEDDANIADDLTVGDASTFGGDATFNGGSGALTVNGPIARGPWFEATFNEGASKGVALHTQLGAAYATTADAVNHLAYGQHRFLFVTDTTATGTITPAGTALGLDLNAGSPGNSDEWTFSTGYGTSNVGGMITPGTTPAWEACATVNGTDVSEIAGLFLEVTTPGVSVVLSSADPNYTSYAAIGIEQTDIVVSDNTDGAVDTTVDAVDLTPVALCIRGSAAGVITYYINGTQTAAAATHTLGDGVPHVVRIQGLNHTGTEAPMNVSSFSLLPQ